MPTSRLPASVLLTALLLPLLPLPAAADGLFGMERRREQFPTDFGYFVYPISGKVPGIGTASGGGGTVTNMGGTDTDLTGFAVRGDFEATGVVLLNYHLVEERVILDVGNYTAKVAPQSYRRGIGSSRDDYLNLEVESEITVAQLTHTSHQRMLEFYIRGGFGSSRLDRVYDADGNRFEGVDTSRKYFQAASLGMSLDVTDDRQDPRRGVRFEIKDQMLFHERRAEEADYDVLDVNLTGYHPVGGRHVLAFNAFYSTALIKRGGITDREQIRSERGLACDGIAEQVRRSDCLVAEEKLIDEIVAGNSYGRATPLGGTQRLRSFPNGRYFAGQSLFFGTEFRYNLTDEATPMDWFFLKGVRTNVQFACFAGAGSVADEFSGLTGTMKTSVGAGVRVLFSGVTIRFDLAYGDEGTEGQLFLDYPWSMFSVDNVI